MSNRYELEFYQRTNTSDIIESQDELNRIMEQETGESFENIKPGTFYASDDSIIYVNEIADDIAFDEDEDVRVWDGKEGLERYFAVHAFHNGTFEFYGILKGSEESASAFENKISAGNLRLSEPFQYIDDLRIFVESNSSDQYFDLNMERFDADPFVNVELNPDEDEDRSQYAMMYYKDEAGFQFAGIVKGPHDELHEEAQLIEMLNEKMPERRQMFLSKELSTPKEMADFIKEQSTSEQESLQNMAKLRIDRTYVALLIERLEQSEVE